MTAPAHMQETETTVSVENTAAHFASRHAQGAVSPTVEANGFRASWQAQLAIQAEAEQNRVPMPTAVALPAGTAVDDDPLGKDGADPAVHTEGGGATTKDRTVSSSPATKSVSGLASAAAPQKQRVTVSRSGDMTAHQNATTVSNVLPGRSSTTRSASIADDTGASKDTSKSIRDSRPSASTGDIPAPLHTADALFANDAQTQIVSDQRIPADLNAVTGWQPATNAEARGLSGTRGATHAPAAAATVSPETGAGASAASTIPAVQEEAPVARGQTNADGLPSAGQDPHALGYDASTAGSRLLASEPVQQRHLPRMQTPEPALNQDGANVTTLAMRASAGPGAANPAASESSSRLSGLMSKGHGAHGETTTSPSGHDASLLPSAANGAASRATIPASQVAELRPAGSAGLESPRPASLPLESRTTHPGPAASDTFNALDGEGTAPQPTWIHTGAQRAEAGYLDPTLGWVRVRADASGSGLHATVLPGSMEAAQAIGSHLAGLNTYLAEQQLTNARVTLDYARDSREASTPDGTDMSHSNGQNGEQASAQDRQPGATVGGSGMDLAPGGNSAPANAGTAATDLLQNDRRGVLGGVHVSVMA